MLNLSIKPYLKIILFVVLTFQICFGQDNNSFNKGKEEFLTGNYSNAVKNLLKVDSGESDLDYLIAMSYFNLKDYTNAIVYFTKDLEKNKTNLNSYLKRAESKKQIGQIKSAFEDLNKIIEIDKTYYLAYYEKGNLIFDEKKYDLAIKEYNKALSIKPHFESAFYRMGFCHLNLKDTVKACENWKKIEDLDDFENYEKIEIILKLKTKLNK